MKLKDFIADILEQDPDAMDFDICLSDYMQVPDPESEGADDDYQVVVDIPIRGIAVNNESKEIRLVLFKSDVDALAKVKKYKDLKRENLDDDE